MADRDESQKKIEEYRACIDSLDEQIVDLLNKRAEQSLAIRELKPSAQMGLYDPRREEEILERLDTLNDGPMYGDDLREIYRTILKVMKEIRA
ncbi:MAG: chorismate mutase [Coriobacteriaceae bacterium]|nr:chorismate mutase [Coriobacteriaceae bacterium]